MSKRRHALNPAKLKADIAALEEHPPPEALAPRLDIRRGLSLLLLCLLSSLVLVISFAPFDRWYLAYVALVPWGLAVAGGRSRRWTLLCAYLGGVLFWAVGIYWLTWITLLGYVALMLYLGAYWLAAAAVVRAAFNRRWPMWLVLPAVWVTMEYALAYALWPMLSADMSGFPWYYLAHSQYRRTQLIQVVDITGPYGVSFFVAMVNGAIIDALAQPLFVRLRCGTRLTKLISTAAAACLVTAAGMMGYGAWRLRQATVRPGPVVGVVQMAFPISLVHEGSSGPDIFDAHLLNTQGGDPSLLGAGCDLVVWPESMLGMWNMDPQYWREVADPNHPLHRAYPLDVIATYQDKLRKLSELLGKLRCPLLAGGGMRALRAAPEERLSCNSAVLIKRDEKGRLRMLERYDKMHLVPFSECVPFRDGWPGLHRLLRRFVPEQMPQLEPGRRKVRFEIDGPGGKFRLAVPICYEGVFARVCRALADRAGREPADLLVNLSNDGWFIYKGRRYVFAGGQITHASTELEQHLTQYVFRAIENRVPVVRAVNTGISAHVDSNGRIVQSVSRGGRRKMVAGNLVAQTLVDDRVSPYSRVGNLFAVVVSVVVGAGAVLLAILALRARPRGKAAGKKA